MLPLYALEVCRRWEFPWVHSVCLLH